MSETQTLDRFADEEPFIQTVAPARPRLASAGRVFVVMVVCLGLWGVLAAPALERNAAAGPIGARRAVALALLRPLGGISDALRLSRASEAVERALGRDPRGTPGGELVLPDLNLPPEVVVPAPTTPEPAPPITGNGQVPPPEPTPTQEGEPQPPELTGIRSPTSSNRLRVAVIGDSLAQGLGPAIERAMDPEVVRVLSLGRISTGLSRQDYFNWQAGMRQIVEEFRPDLVFIMLGSNDGQDQIARDGSEIPVGSAEWIEGYEERAGALLREATEAGTHVVWVGIPIVEERQRWAFYRRVNGIYRDAARSDPMATYVDTWAAFEARAGGYAAYIRNERGLLQLMRAPDGIHFTPSGYWYLGRLAMRAATEAFGLPQEAVSFRI